MMFITTSGQSDLFIWLGRGREGYFIWLKVDDKRNNPTVPWFPDSNTHHTRTQIATYSHASFC